MRGLGTRGWGLRVVLAIASLVSASAATLQSVKPAAQVESVPPLSFTCPMHPEIVEDKKGICPICRMDLVGIRLDSVWTCGTRPLAVIESKPGRCPIDGTPLVQVTATNTGNTGKPVTIIIDRTGARQVSTPRMTCTVHDYATTCVTDGPVGNMGVPLVGTFDSAGGPNPQASAKAGGK